MKNNMFQLKKMMVFTLLTLSILNFSFILSYSQVNLQWAKQLKGANNEVGTSIAVDGSGNVYTVGYFDGTTDFDPGSGSLNYTTQLWDDIFVSKLDASGNLVWAKQFSGNNDDYGQSIAVDASGNVYVTGFFNGTVDFDPGTGTSNLTTTGNNDIFVVKLTSSGNLSWAKKIGGTLRDDAYSLKLDASSNVIITGTFAGTVDFDPGTGTSNLVSVGSQDIFILKLNSSGNYVWAKNIGSLTADCGWGVAVDGTGNVFATGSYTGTADFDPGNSSTFNMTASANKDIFILKLDASGNFGWAKSIGGANDEEGFSIAVDGTGNIAVTGFFYGTVDFDPGSGTSNLTSTGYDVFIIKITSAGVFSWAKNIGGSVADYGKSVTFDGSGNVYTSGYFMSTVDFDPGSGTSNLTSKGAADAFLLKLSSSGNFTFARQFGGTATDQGLSLILNSSNNIYMTGLFSSTVDFDPGSATVNLTAGGNYDTFILKLDMATGIDEINNNFNYSIFPNPSNGKFNIETENSFINTIEIFDIVGKKIYSKLNIKNTKSEVDISNQNNGVYFINVTTNKINFTTKIILQK